MNDISVFARKNDCVVNASGGRGGTMQIRYGALNLPVIDMTVDGVVTVYVRPSNNADHAETLTRSLTEALASEEKLRVTVGRQRASAKIEDMLEEIDEEALQTFITQAVGIIRENVYQANA